MHSEMHTEAAQQKSSLVKALPSQAGASKAKVSFAPSTDTMHHSMRSRNIETREETCESRFVRLTGSVCLQAHGFLAKAAMLNSSTHSILLPAFSDTRPTYQRDAQDDEISSYEDSSGGYLPTNCISFEITYQTKILEITAQVMSVFWYCRYLLHLAASDTRQNCSDDNQTHRGQPAGAIKGANEGSTVGAAAIRLH